MAKQEFEQIRIQVPEEDVHVNQSRFKIPLELIGKPFWLDIHDRRLSLNDHFTIEDGWAILRSDLHAPRYDNAVVWFTNT